MLLGGPELREERFTSVGVCAQTGLLGVLLVPHGLVMQWINSLLCRRVLLCIVNPAQ